MLLDQRPKRGDVVIREHERVRSLHRRDLQPFHWWHQVVSVV